MKHKLLEDLKACDPAVAFASNYSTLQDAWNACECGDWMLWFASRRNVKRETLVLAACECARLALPHTKDPRVLACIETTERWCRGEATILQVREARAYAYAYAAAYAAYAADAADADAAAAADAAADAAYADAAAADAAAAYAAYAADAARTKTLKLCADIVRKHFPTLP
jgi:hypothetical protein